MHSLSYPKWKIKLLCLKLYTWSPSMPLLTPLRRKGRPAPMLKEANYSQYLPHSREARSFRGQACETFLQPAAADGPPSQPSVSLSSSFFPHLHPPSTTLISLCPLLHAALIKMFLIDYQKYVFSLFFQYFLLSLR